MRDLLRNVMGISYTAMKSAKWDQRILLNGQPVTVDTATHAGDVLSICPTAAEPAYRLKPYDLPLRVPYRDEYLMIVDKPAPLASQSSAGHPDDSLENALFSYFGTPEDFIYRPVNRLDRGTSGLMVIAMDPYTQHLLQRQLHTSDFERTYQAITVGIPSPPEGIINLPISKVPSASVKRQVDPEGKPSVTHYSVLETHGNLALVRLRLETGRTHQIRVHMSALGCPVFGDFLYGQEDERLPGRFALHAEGLKLKHPVKGEWLEVHSPLPDEMTALFKDSSEPYDK